ncbi:hypothetical protein [Lysobacter sp. N42]|uniref:hypothetical protein n=1 Tax=Lysobacter sp. N42 TaxID=2545719 RepID=UPI001044D935|nr:hypothetical protein [Lysobacter sp. N42]TCZ87732.1 hypothetical protein EYQ95_15570 [Lysobacter sp. N42]
MRTVLLSIALACSLAGPREAAAQVVYRCVEKGKPVSLQSHPCEGAARATATRAYVPERAPTANELAWRHYRTEREMALRNARLRQPVAPAGAVLPAGGDACAQAKADRDDWERRAGLSRDLDSLRAWQERVQRACR